MSADRRASRLIAPALCILTLLVSCCAWAWSYGVMFSYEDHWIEGRDPPLWDAAGMTTYERLAWHILQWAGPLLGVSALVGLVVLRRRRSRGR